MGIIRSVRIYPSSRKEILAILKEGTKGFGVVLTWELEVLAILKEGTKGFGVVLTRELEVLAILK